VAAFLFVSVGSCLQGADAENRLPFANSGNPVMALVGHYLYFMLYLCLLESILSINSPIWLAIPFMLK
jgi:hypothetical protein